MIFDRVLDATLPEPERSWDAPFAKRLPSAVALAMARTILRRSAPRSDALEGTRVVAFGNLGDNLRLLSVLSRFPIDDVTVDANVEAAAATALYQGVRSGAAFSQHGITSIFSRKEKRPSRIALVPHPFVTQPAALVRAMRNAGSVVATATGEYPAPRGTMRFAHPDRTSWRTFYETFFEEALNMRPDTDRPRLGVAYRHVSNRSATVLVHLSSRYPKRAMPRAAARAVLGALIDSGTTVALLGTPAERLILEDIAGDRGVELLVGRSLVDVAELMAASRAFVGVDSAMMNLADAVGIPNVIVYPFTDPNVEGPFYSPSIPIRMGLSPIHEVTMKAGRAKVAEADWSTAPARVLEGLSRIAPPP